MQVTAYYVVSEALTNTAEHADASAAQVTVDAHDGDPELSVRDDEWEEPTPDVTPG